MQRQAVRLIVINDKNQVLLAKSARSGNIKFLGGGIETGETPVSAAVRELAEESHLGVKPDDLKYLGEVAEIISDDNPNIAHGLRPGQVQRSHYYVVQTEAKFEVGDEIQELLWVDQAEVAEKLTYPTQRESFTQLYLGQETQLTSKQWTKKIT